MLKYRCIPVVKPQWVPPNNNLCSVVDRVQIGKQLKFLSSGRMCSNLAVCSWLVFFPSIPPRKRWVMTTSHYINNSNLEQPEGSQAAHFVWQHFAVSNNTDAWKGSAKNAVCLFCDKSFSGCSNSRAAAHILRHLVLAQ